MKLPWPKPATKEAQAEVDPVALMSQIVAVWLAGVRASMASVEAAAELARQQRDGFAIVMASATVADRMVLAQWDSQWEAAQAEIASALEIWRAAEAEAEALVGATPAEPAA